MRNRYCVPRHAVTQPSDSSYRLIPLTQGQNAIVDAGDFDWLNHWNWCAQWNSHTNSFYARRKHCVAGKWEHLAMHAVILGCSEGQEGDHKNHDTLDNRRTNLRKCTEQQNGYNCRKHRRNTSGFKGVFWDEGERKWRAAIRHNNKLIHLGRFFSKEAAARCYDEAATRLHGEFAYLNLSASPARNASVSSASDRR